MERPLRSRPTALVRSTIADFEQELSRSATDYPLLAPDIRRHFTVDLRRALSRVDGLLGEAAPTVHERARELRAIQWREATLEVLRHARHDWSILRRVAPAARERLTRFESGLGDPHDDGRTVTRVAFGKAGEVFHKPRSAEADRATFRVVQWIEQRMNRRLPPVPWVENVGQRSWMAPVSSRAVGRRDAEIAARRIGEWLAILDMLQTSDIHGDNIRWNAGAFVPVDLETVLQPHVQWTDGLMIEPEDAASVLRVGLLPSGFALNVPGEVQVVHDSDGIGIWLHTRADACCDGFATMYRALLRHRTALVESDPMRQLRDAPVRVVLRATRTYVGVIRQAWAGIADPQQRVLSRVATGASRMLRCLESEPWPRIVRTSEARDIAHLDVPRFSTTVRDAVLVARQATIIPGAIMESGWSRACRWLAHASERDLAQRIAVIRATLQLAVLRRRMQAGAAGPTRPHKARRR